MNPTGPSVIVGGCGGCGGGCGDDDETMSLLGTIGDTVPDRRALGIRDNFLWDTVTALTFRRYFTLGTYVFNKIPGIDC